MSELTKFIIILLIQVYLSVTIDHLYLDPHEPLESKVPSIYILLDSRSEINLYIPIYILIISSRFMLK